jgi:hypothetical protein
VSIEEHTVAVTDPANRREGGRKPKEESRADEFRHRLIAWKQTPASSRPSLRALARELGASHQLLAYYLEGLEEWRWRKELEQFRANAKAKNVPLTPAVERRYLAWLTKMEARRVRETAQAVKLVRKNAALVDSLKHLLLPDPWWSDVLERSTK